MYIHTGLAYSAHVCICVRMFVHSCAIGIVLSESKMLKTRKKSTNSRWKRYVLEETYFVRF